MTIREKTIAALKGPIASEPFSLATAADSRPAIDRILEGLMQRAAKGEVAAARELREYLTLKDDI